MCVLTVSLCFKNATRVSRQRTDKSVCLGHANALDKDTEKAVNNPEGSAMLADVRANYSVTIKYNGIA